MNNENNQNNQNNFQQPMNQTYPNQGMDPNQMYNQQPMNQTYPNQGMNPNQMYNQQPMNQTYPNQGMDPNQMYNQQPVNQTYPNQGMDPNQMYNQQPMNQAYPNQGMDPNQMYNQQQVVQPQPQVQQPFNNNTVSTEFHEEKPKKSIPLFPIVLVLLVAVGGFFGYQLFFNNKAVVETEIKTLFKATNSGLDALLKNTTNIDSSKNIVGYTGTLTIDSDYAADGIDLTKLKNYKFTYSGASDSKTNSSSFHGTLNNAYGPYIDIKTLTKDNTAYVQLGDIFGKVIKVDTETSIVNANIDRTAQIQASKILIEKTEPILMEYVDESKIERTSEEKNFNGKEKKYNKISYAINLGDAEKYIAQKYLDDKEIIAALSILLEQSEDEVKETLQNVNSSTSDDNKIIMINAYKNTLSLKAEAMEIISYSNDNTDSKSVIELTQKDNGTNFRLLNANNDELANGVITEDEFHMYNKDRTIELNAKFDDNNISGNYAINSSNVSMNVDFNSKNDNNKVDQVLKLSITANGQTMNITFNNQMEVTTEAVVENLDTTYAVTAEQITPEERQYIANQLQQKIAGLENDLITAQYRKDTSLVDFFKK